MKQSHKCPKCESMDVTRIKAFPNAQSSLIQLSKWGTQLGYFDRYVCLSCGYLEHYANLEEKGWQKWLNKKKEEDTLDSDFV